MLLDNLLEADKPIPWPTRVLKAMSDLRPRVALTFGRADLTILQELATA
jgi:hypothetical protein